MKRHLKKQLEAVFQPPPPKGKRAFLKKLPAPQMTFGQFFLGQLSYIRKRVWLAWGLCLGLIPPLVQGTEDFSRLFWIVSALLPFAALLAIVELTRSASFQMAELEMTCRFSLHHIVLTRMSILGAGSLVLLLGISLLLARQPQAFGLLRLTLYLVSPYLLASAGALCILNRWPEGDALPLCGGVSGTVSLGCIFLSGVPGPELTQGCFLPLWAALALAALILTLIQGHKFFKGTEELPWSSSWTG